MAEQVEDIVSQLLRSPQLRHSLESAIRNVTNRQSSGTTDNITTTSHSALNVVTPAASVRDELHRLFPTIRSNLPHRSNSTVLTVSNNTRRSTRRRSSIAESYFHRDVILLKSPIAITTLKGSTKSAAFEEGFAFSNAQFNSAWSCDQIMSSIRELFPTKLNGVDFEIMLPMSGRLVKPNLPPNIEMNGKAMKNMFNQKVVYIRPNTVIISATNNECFPYTEHVEHELVAINDEGNSIVEICQDDTNVTVNSHEDADVTLVTLLRSLNEQIIDTTITQFNIYRDEIFTCCLRALRRPSFSPFNKISVKFSDIEGTAEGAVDVGGPTREMFRLVMNYVKERLFFGVDKKYIRLDMDAVNKNHYHAAGQLIALSLIHGGSGPQFFSDSFYSVLCLDIAHGFPTMDDIEDNQLRAKIQELANATDVYEIQERLDDPFFTIAGCNCIRSIDDKDSLLEDIKNFYAYHRIRPALEQFREGLQTGMILELIKSHPTIFKEVMCYCELITASMLEDLFAVDYSEFGSSKRNVENRTISYWRDFVLDCEGNDTDITLKQILIFVTGAESVPPLGYENKPKISFLHDDTLYPKANTCGLEIKLPTVHKTYDDFKYHTTFGIGNCNDFAFA